MLENSPLHEMFRRTAYFTRVVYFIGETHRSSLGPDVSPAAQAPRGDNVPKTTKKSGSKEGSVTVDRRAKATTERRGGKDRRTKTEPVAAERRQLERRVKVSRRRQIDPTTCERDYSVEEVEFMRALEQYKRTSGRMFPTCSEVLEVLRGLGYEKVGGLHHAPAVVSQAVEVFEAELHDSDE